MLRIRVLRAATAVTLLGLVPAALTVSLTSGSATAAVAATHPASGATSVTVVLKAPDASALRSLAGNKSLPRATKLARLADLVPSHDTANDVASGLSDHGLTVTDATTWTLTATGSATRIRSLFGPTPAATNQPLAIPSFLSDDVAVALASTGAPQFKPRAAVTGVDVRNANTAANTTPAAGADTGDFTIATVQFANLTNADLTRYAASLGVPDPVTSHQYTAVKVGSGAVDDQDGEGEVALDQEAILATSPAARQRAYFAPNTDAGFIALVSKVSDDAATYNISALSSSWGGCESSWAPSTRASMDNIFAALATKGVTTFSASGDDGIYDCVDYDNNGNVASYSRDVDYPASSPYVVGVGGTNLAASNRASNTGTNWVETAWSCTDDYSCIEDTGGSGGGASTAYSQPSYQTDNLSSTYKTGKRLVPDIASVGDPSTGLRIYYNGQTTLSGLIGGTSLATPLSAALLTNALAGSGRTCGVGDVHSALYSSYAASQALGATSSTKAFRDVTSGTNGASADRGTDPSVSAVAGYDTVTGLGAVLWNAFMADLPQQTTTCHYTGDPTAPAPAPAATPVPSAAISVAKVKKHKHPAKRTVVATWSIANPSARGETITVVDTTAHKALASSASPSGSLRFKVKKKHRVTITVIAYDAAGGAHPASASVKTPKR